MKITKLTKRHGRTICVNATRFEYVRLDEELTAELSDRDNFEQAEQELYNKVTYMLSKDIERMREDRKNAKQNKETSD